MQAEEPHGGAVSKAPELSPAARALEHLPEVQGAVAGRAGRGERRLCDLGRAAPLPRGLVGGEVSGDARAEGVRREQGV